MSPPLESLFDASVAWGLEAGLFAALVLYHLPLSWALRARNLFLYAVLVALIGAAVLLPLLPLVRPGRGLAGLAWAGAVAIGVVFARAQRHPGKTALVAAMLAGAGLELWLGGDRVQRLLSLRAHLVLGGLAAGALALSLGLARAARRLRLERAEAERRAAAVAEASLQQELEAARKLHGLREQLVGQLLVVREAERAELAGTLHDNLGQWLLALKNRLQEGPPAPLVQECIDETRALARTLHPHQVRRLGLRRAVEALAESLCEKRTLVIDCEVADLALGDRDLHLYRVIQEALTNAVVHGQPRYVEVAVRAVGGEVEASVSDDGAGFDVAAALADARHLGLAEMQERARLLGGRLSLQSSPEGSEALLRFPLQAGSVTVSSAPAPGAERTTS